LLFGSQRHGKIRKNNPEKKIDFQQKSFLLEIDNLPTKLPFLPPLFPIHFWEREICCRWEKQSQVLGVFCDCSIVTINGNIKYIQPWKILNQVKSSFHEASRFFSIFFLD
jgi:hypothetical protein